MIVTLIVMRCIKSRISADIQITDLCIFGGRCFAGSFPMQRLTAIILRFLYSLRNRPNPARLYIYSYFVTRLAKNALYFVSLPFLSNSASLSITLS